MFPIVAVCLAVGIPASDTGTLDGAAATGNAVVTGEVMRALYGCVTAAGGGTTAASVVGLGAGEGAGEGVGEGVGEVRLFARSA